MTPVELVGQGGLRMWRRRRLRWRHLLLPTDCMWGGVVTLLLAKREGGFKVEHSVRLGRTAMSVYIGLAG